MKGFVFSYFKRVLKAALTRAGLAIVPLENKVHYTARTNLLAVLEECRSDAGETGE